MGRRSCVLVLAVVLSACGSAPLAPTPPPVANVAGSWSGTFQYTSGNASPNILAMVASLSQAGATVSGTYTALTFDGTVSGTTTATSFAGTFTFNGRNVSGTACTGTFAASGSAGSGSTVTWTSPAVVGNCTGLPGGITVALQRR